jgi:exosortase/archaeosortase family protein
VVKLKKNVLFLLKFFVIFIAMVLVIEVSDFGIIQKPITFITATLSGLEFSDISVFVKDGIFLITEFCTGFLSIAVVASIVFALKKPDFSKKIAIFVASAISLFFLNIVRIFLVLEVGKNFGIKAAELFHIVSWFSTAGLIIIAWYYFTKRIAKVDNFSQLL